MKTIYPKTLLIVTILLLMPTIYLLASPSMPGFGRDAGAPIDGGISLLIAAGIGYGAKKVRDSRKKSLQQPANDEAGSDNK